eukprot:Stramenopile-MAST_4_protein_991
MNEYHIYEELGKGSKSIVYKGRKHKSVEYVAVKSVEKDQMDKVLHEVQLLYRLKHPNILRFFNWYETGNHIWLILEYCTGGDLLQLLMQDARMPEQALKVLGVDLVSGLHHLHSLGLLYCHLKPSNVLVDEFGVLKLCDFGLARAIPTIDDVDEGPRRGTPCYMAPELFGADGVYSTASDLWSLGCVLYELAVGSPPFVSSNFEDLVEMIMYSPAPLANEQIMEKSKDHVTLSRQFRNLLSGLLEKAPEDRLSWNEVLQHPFWDARLTPQAAPMPEETLFMDSVEKRRRARREHATAETSTSSPRNVSVETPSQIDRPVSSKVESAGIKEKTVADIFRLSRIVRENLEADGTPLETADKEGNGGLMLPTADMELDFNDRGADLLVDEEIIENHPSQDGLAANDDTSGGENPRALLSPVEFIRRETSLHSTNVRRREEPETDTDRQNATNVYNRTPVNNFAGNTHIETSTQSSLLELVLGGLPTSVTPISGNRSIESLPAMRFKASALPFQAESLAVVVEMEQGLLEQFLTKVYRSVSGTSRRKSTPAEKANALGYLSTLCKSTRIANLLVNSSLMNLFIKLNRASATSPGLRSRICRIFAALFRHATFISGDLCDDGIVQMFVEIVRDPNVEVRRAGMAALSELIFYITTEEEKDNSSSDRAESSRSKWIIPGSIISLIGKSLHPEGGNDDVVQHYATKLLQNIFTQGKSQQVARFASLDIALSLRHGFKHGRNEAHRFSAMSALALLLRRNPKVLHKVVDKSTIEAIVSSVSDLRPKPAQPGLVMLNLVLYHGRAATTLKHSRKMLVEIPDLLEGIMRFLDHSPKGSACRGHALLAIRLLVEGNPKFIAATCNGKLLHTLERVALHIRGSDNTSQYLRDCLNNLLYFLANATTDSLEHISKRVANICSSSPSVDKTGIRYETFIANDGIEAAFVVLPALLPLMQSKLMVQFLNHSPLALGLFEALSHLRPFTSEKWNELREILFVILETFSKNSLLILHPNQSSVVVSQLLPYLIKELEIPNGNTRILCMKMCFDLLTCLFDGLRHAASNSEPPNESLISLLSDFLEVDLFPSLTSLIRQEEPIPQYALKMLYRILNYDKGYIEAVYNFDLSKEIVRCLYTRTRVGEGEMSVSTHAAKVLECVVEDDQSKITLLHRFDIVNQICKAVLSAVREGVESSYEPLVHMVFVILDHAHSLVQNKDSGVSVDDVRETCEDFIAVDFMEAIKQLTQHGLQRAAESPLRSYGNRSLSLLQELFPNTKQNFV